MATYNGSKYIKEQLLSILSQIGPGDEVIISDDNSTDKTVEIIKDIKDNRIKLFAFDRIKDGLLPVNLITSNFENALKHAVGDYIYLSDQDDVWCPDKVETIQKYLKDYDYVVSDCYVTDKNLKVMSPTRFDGSVTKNKYKALISPTPWQGSCAAFNRNVLDRALPFPKNLQSHDRWIGYIGSLFYKSLIIEKPLIYYRRHDDNTSSGGITKSNASIMYKVGTRLYYIFNLLKRSFQ